MLSPRRNFIEAVGVQTVQSAKRDILHIDLVYTQFKRVKRNTLFGIVASCLYVFSLFLFILNFEFENTVVIHI